MAETGGQDNVNAEVINPAVEVVDTEAANQPQNTSDLNTPRLNQAMGIQTGTILQCVDPSCEFSTQPCNNYDMAYSLLDMHINCMHMQQPREENTQTKLLFLKFWC